LGYTSYKAEKTPLFKARVGTAPLGRGGGKKDSGHFKKKKRRK